MAERRCLSKKVVESDAFYHLPAATQAVYVHLCMIADDDGFINCADPVSNMFRSGRSHVKKLIDSRFLLEFNGILVVKHWRVMNSLKTDRIKTLNYPEIAKKIWIKENKAYTDRFCEDCPTLFDFKNGIQMESKRNPNGIHSESQGKGNEGNRNEGNRSEPKGKGLGWFDRVWELYPDYRKGDRKMAEDAFRDQVLDGNDFDMLMYNLKAWVESSQWTKDGGQYIPYLSNWLSKGIWKTYPPTESSPWGPVGPRTYSQDLIDHVHRMFNVDQPPDGGNE